MILLFDLLTPDMGLMFWTILIFGILLVILWKFAWTPITAALKTREDHIDKALNEARTAREEIANLKAENEKVLIEAKLERDALIREAREHGDKIVDQARKDAQGESKRIMQETRESVEREKNIAFKELKKDISDLIIDLASKVIKKELSGTDEHKVFIEKNLKEL